MKLPSEKIFNGPAGYAVAVLFGGVVIYGLYVTFRKEIAGLFTGNNALTEGTPYEGAGVAGTLGAGANAVSGGVLSEAGSWLGGKVYDIFHPSSGLMQTFIINFPDGSKHAVNSEDIDSAGRFVYAGKRYELVTDGAGMKFARPV